MLHACLVLILIEVALCLKLFHEKRRKEERKRIEKGAFKVTSRKIKKENTFEKKFNALESLLKLFIGV